MKKKISITHVVAMTAFVLLVSACGSKKVLVNDKQGKVDATTSATPSSATKPQPTGAETLSVKKMSAVMRVNDNAVTTETISSKIKFNIKTGSKDITVPGTLRMKKDDVIRLHLQIPILGSEAGRLEFTKDYVLILDRIHMEYIKADYNQVEFLKRNGLTFHSLQALFWNQLFMPGKESLTIDDMKEFDMDLPSGAITLKKGKMTYSWQTNSQALIEKTSVVYSSAKDGDTKVDVGYSDFLPLGVKQFPSEISIDMNTGSLKGKKKNIQVNLTLNNPSTDGKWETRTEVSKKFKQVSVEDVLGRLMNL